MYIIPRIIRSVTTLPKNKFSVKLAVKNYSPNEVKVKVNNGYLVIEGRHEENGPQGKTTREFTKWFRIPEDVDCNTLVHKMTPDGTLSLTANKKVGPGASSREVGLKKLSVSSGNLEEDTEIKGTSIVHYANKKSETSRGGSSEPGRSQFGTNNSHDKEVKKASGFKDASENSSSSPKGVPKKSGPPSENSSSPKGAPGESDPPSNANWDQKKMSGSNEDETGGKEKEVDKQRENLWPKRLNKDKMGGSTPNPTKGDVRTTHKTEPKKEKAKDSLASQNKGTTVVPESKGIDSESTSVGFINRSDDPTRAAAKQGHSSSNEVPGIKKQEISVPHKYRVTVGVMTPQNINSPPETTIEKKTLNDSSSGSTNATVNKATIPQATGIEHKEKFQDNSLKTIPKQEQTKSTMNKERTKSETPESQNVKLGSTSQIQQTESKSVETKTSLTEDKREGKPSTGSKTSNESDTSKGQGSENQKSKVIVGTPGIGISKNSPSVGTQRNEKIYDSKSIGERTNNQRQGNISFPEKPKGKVTVLDGKDIEPEIKTIKKDTSNEFENKPYETYED